MVSLNVKTTRMMKKRKRTTDPALTQKTCARSMRTLTTWVQAAAITIMNARVTEFAALK